MTDTYTPEAFATSFSVRGYGQKKAALEWCETNGIELPVESDFERCYRAVNQPVIRPHRSTYTALYIDGQNPVDPANAPNSYGESFAAQMGRVIRELEALDRAVRKQNERIKIVESEVE